jgi:RHS repeat-associated protein
MMRVGIVGKQFAAMAVVAIGVKSLFASVPIANLSAIDCFHEYHTTSANPSGATDAFGNDLSACGSVCAEIPASRHAQAGGLGNWTTYTNAEGRVYTMTCDALGRLVAATNAANEQVFVNAYDSVGNLTNRTDGAGNSIAYSYDVLNRLVARDAFHHEEHEGREGFGYDAVGNLLTASNETATLLFSYDAMDRLTSSVSRVSVSPVSSFEFPVSYARDAGGLVTNLVYAPGKAVARTYDPDGRLASVSDWHGRTWTFAWDGAGKPTGGTSPGGIVSTNHYDAAGRLSSWSVGSLAGRTVTRDLAGLKTRDDITAGPHPAPAFVRYAENTFDAADRLVSASVRYGSHTNAAVSETYLYDGNGALTNLVSGSNAVFSAAYDPLGQLSSLRLCASALNLSCDPLGNRVVSGDRLWLPDHADPLKRPLIEADAATGEPIRYYLWGPGRLLGFIDAASGALTVAHCDEYGSVVALTDASGNTLHTACYGPNGQDWGTTGTNPTPFAWLGGHGVQKSAVSDHLGPLYLTRYRLYAASLNRFLSSDPLGLAGGLNLYAYAEGDPLSYIDPLGLCAEERSSYLGRSFGQLLKGNYTDDVTAFGTVMQVLTGVVNFDLPGDIRDNVYNLTHWSDVSTSQKIIDVVGLLPVIGALKYADEAGDVLKGGSRAADAASAAAKTVPEDVTYLYQKVGAQGEHLKFGITKNPATRYTQEELAGGKLRIVGQGPREEMLQLERNIHETLPIGPEEAQNFYIQKQVQKGLNPPPYGGK